MAVLALALAGSAIGAAAIGGTILGVSAATIGFAAGEVAGNLLFPQKQTSEGPRVGDLSVQASTYGSAIPIIYGTMRVAGNVIFSTDKREVKNEQTPAARAARRSPRRRTPTTSTWRLRCAKGPSTASARCGSTASSSTTRATPRASRRRWPAASTRRAGRSISATKTQLPDPTIETTVGVGNVPGYRGMAYIVFDHLDCPNGQVPQLSFEIVASGTSGPSSITFEQVPAPDAPLFALASIVENRVWQFVGDNGAQPVYSAGPGFFSSEGVRLFSTSDGGDAGAHFGARRLVRDVPLVRAGPVVRNRPQHHRRGSGHGRDEHTAQYIPGTSSNSLSPAFAAYDPISGDFCAITSAETDIRGACRSRSFRRRP
jgi:hypothetical protein